MYATPLRYPGGKSIMTPFLKRLFQANGWGHPMYAEPYAGGAGAAINLLVTDSVERIFINDANIGIYSFWEAVKKDNGKLCEWICSKPITLDSWKYWHNIFMSSVHPSFELGFATFFLSRTNRSGILNAGPMGGNSPQKQEEAQYKIDCRFNREKLAKKVEKIGVSSRRIEVSNLDALVFLEKISNKGVFVYLDPPYYIRGSSLYMNYYTSDSHKELATFLIQNKQLNWIMSYDDVEAIRNIYQDFEQYHFTLNYSARESRVGKEILLHNIGLVMPENMTIMK